MKVVILCGGKGTRMLPTTEEMPKPMIHVGNRPILWHIMKLYAKNGHKDFILLTGFKASLIQEYFSNPQNIEPDWNVTFVDTGVDATKGERLMALKGKLKDEDFLLAYGDDLCNVNINDVIDVHQRNGKTVTITTVRLASPFGVVEMNEDGIISKFKEKPILDYWISGGYIVANSKIIDMIKPGMDETDVFEELAAQGQVQALKHYGFWKTMNTVKDLQDLNDLWSKGELQKQLGIENHEC
ncbi:MAG: sugar phosphate nucleotidyltransferase [Candidatus Aenigmarchaeota archaeon]|nr:sugar phosphate nucleotidyltransferase [Candidatus Aenigmarchaeota archaeon]